MMKNIKFYVYDMKCEKNCAKKIIECLKDIKGINLIELNFQNRLFNVTYNDLQILNIEELLYEEIKYLGYTFTLYNQNNKNEINQEFICKYDENVKLLNSNSKKKNIRINKLENINLTDYFKIAKISIIGMNCGSCANKIETFLKSNPCIIFYLFILIRY